ncbi:MAG: DNRLRE domain-containing protein [Parcubacteria group bacterium]|nr:DNRLRE domain-containing protein [Parcubacteria group bacterium]
MTKVLGSMGIWIFIFAVVLCLIFGTCNVHGVGDSIYSFEATGDTYVTDHFRRSYYNMGANHELICGFDGEGRNTILVQCDLYNMVLDGTRVSEAIMTFCMINSSGGDKKFVIRRILKSWAEGDGAGNVKADGNESCGRWTGTGGEWGAIGAREPGNDFESIANGVIAIGNTIGLYEFDITQMVQYWVRNPDDNHGLTVQEVSSGDEIIGVKIFTSREHPDTNLRPVLSVFTDSMVVKMRGTLLSTWGAVKDGIE